MPRADRWLIIGFLVPGVAVFALVIVVPVAWALRLSAYRLDSVASPGTFVGLDNYVRVLQESVFWRDTWTTLVYTGASVASQVVLGVAIALLLNQVFPCRELARGITFVPYIIPSIVVAITWKWMLQVPVGVISYLLRLLGAGDVELFSYGNAMYTLVVISTWAWMPFVALVFLAGLQTIPVELIDSAKVDGAGRWRRFLHITLPVLKPVVAMIVLLRGIWMFNKFDLIWLVTQGGPVGATETLPILSYNRVFRLQDVGGGTAIACLMLAFLLVVVFFYFRLLRLEEPA